MAMLRAVANFAISDAGTVRLPTAEVDNLPSTRLLSGSAGVGGTKMPI
jgi:hypothetical protein